MFKVQGKHYVTIEYCKAPLIPSPWRLCYISKGLLIW